MRMRLHLFALTAAVMAACSELPPGEAAAMTAQDEGTGAATSHGTPTPGVDAVKLSDDPLATIRALYEGHPWSASPAGGPDLWESDALAAWTAHGGGLVEGVDFMTAGAARTYSGLRVEPGDSSDCEAQVIVTLDNASARDVVIYYGLINSDCDSGDGVWKIANVWRDDGWHLIERLEADAR
jgi:hypothetical protein